ncbi:helix-turn-helix domain-containing protein [Actinoplanes sp. KI2]|uniref:helix-turn-helix domain-containing protein n=1 Tax=Actinoplanes sp. KI2 TaxID=2983315 RepID=UPI0021D5A7B5|nr:helix-turn-helix domain-containing protein [Actinoplanes sp. KI2]MCU7722781.1 helix-turn-helix domain-containing protein [Actinoplanes sp. KI2]
MPYVKYTREVLAEAVAASTTMAGVLRHLGIPLNGGAHAHLRRRIAHCGIDTSHFVGSGHARGAVSPRRRPAAEILVLRTPEAKRQSPTVLRRALEEAGRPYRCAACDIGDVWNERPLTLQVDHVDGRFWDCRAENLRFLCPNCHTQTANYAGRNRPRHRVPLTRVDDLGEPVGPPASENKLEILALVGRREMTVADAARAIGCSPGHVYELRRRFAERGSLEPAPRRPRPRVAHRAEIVAFALGHPLLGPRKIAIALGRREPGPIVVPGSTVATILREAGLGTQQDRIDAAVTMA